jgi:hypothetical protein
MSEGPGDREYMTLLKQIGDIAAVAGVNGTVDDEFAAYTTVFSVDEGRKHRIFVRPTGKVGPGKVVVTFHAIAHAYPKKTMVAAIPSKELMALLTRNEGLMFARYGLRELEDKFLVVASIDCLLETLDGVEFMVAAHSVAQAADAYEATRGKDDL